jgi:hypothetical protein
MKRFKLGSVGTLLLIILVVGLIKFVQPSTPQSANASISAKAPYTPVPPSYHMADAAWGDIVFDATTGNILVWGLY